MQSISFEHPWLLVSVCRWSYESSASPRGQRRSGRLDVCVNVFVCVRVYVRIKDTASTPSVCVCSVCHSPSFSPRGQRRSGRLDVCVNVFVCVRVYVRIKDTASTPSVCVCSVCHSPLYFICVHARIFRTKENRETGGKGINTECWRTAPAGVATFSFPFFLCLLDWL